MVNISYNTNEIVSIEFKEEQIDSYRQLEYYRSIVDFFLIRPKKLMVWYYGDYTRNTLESLGNKRFIRDNKIWYRPSLLFRFSDGQCKDKYFKSNEDAKKFKETLESNKYISI